MVIVLVENALAAALPEGWVIRPWSAARDFRHALNLNDPEAEWTIQSEKYDLGHFVVRLTDDLSQVVFVHSTDIHMLPARIEEATLLHLFGFTQAGLSNIFKELIETKRPNLVHPT